MDRYQKEFEKLNDYQKQAVTAEDGHILLNAAVGSGKTTVLVHKVLYLHLVKQVPLEQMFILTFTRRAAEEIRTRILDFIEDIPEKLKYLGTFHSVAAQVLRESERLQDLGYQQGFEIIDNNESVELLGSIIDHKKLEIKYRKKLNKRLEEFKGGRHLYGVMKTEDDIAQLVLEYNEEKRKRNQMDFDDIIEYCTHVLQQPLNPAWIIIDEFQDTDERQLRLVRRICGEDTKLFCIGDQNQVIYSWRSGTDNIFRAFKEVFSPKELNLPLNYRSSRTILEAANALLMGLHLVEGVKDYGSLINVVRHNDEFNEAHHIASTLKNWHATGVPYRSCAVLYRRQAQLEMLMNIFEKEQVPFQIVYKKKLAFEEAIDPQSIEEESIDKVNLLTLHASKGLEFNSIFIIGANMGNMPLTSNKTEEPEELRLFYVGLTRAKENIEISYVARPSIPGVVPYRSPYIAMIPQNLLSIQDEIEEGKGRNKLSDLMAILREQRTNQLAKPTMAKHGKYGTGEIVYEDEEMIRVRFEEYGEKDFSKMFCSLEIIKE